MLKITVGTTVYDCVNTDAARCTFEQVDTAMPTVASATVSGQTIVFTGTDFKTAGFTARAFFNGIKADSVVVDSATQVTATWTLGVPVVVNATKPVLRFHEDTSITVLVSIMNAEITNALTVTSSSQGLTCSFAGGCSLEVTANGLATMLKQNPAENYISVCENKCTFDETSTSSVAKCKLPSVSTLYSDSNYGIQSSHKLTGMALTSSNAAKQNNLIDGNIHNTYTDPAAECHATFEFKTGYTAILDKVKIFFESNLDKVALFNDKLRF